jgi:MoaA/NifB/PqqE/SkfB family radical SAM enzyme
MPAVIVTATCQNSCPWCFARSKMQQYRTQGIDEMNWYDFLAVVKFYESSNYRQIHLLGGEPTTHSRFIDMLAYLTSRGFFTTVVTNGIIPASLVDALIRQGLPRVRFGLNSTSYFDHEPKKRQAIDYFLRTMPRAIFLSYTITRRDVVRTNLGPILDRLFLIARFGLRPHLQFQIAVPSHGNRDFVPFDHYGAVVKLLQSWTQVLQKNRVAVGLDCHSIPACCIPPDAQLPFPLKSSCTDFVVDIGPNLEVWPCFPLSTKPFRLEQFATLGELRAFFANLSPVEPLLRESRCAGCQHGMSKACDAGCGGFQILRAASISPLSTPSGPTVLTAYNV